MDCCLISSGLRYRASDFAVAHIGHVMKRKKMGGVRCGGLNEGCLPMQPSLFTASRLNASVIRVIGPGSNFDISGFGNVLSLDEFFLYPVHHRPENYETETLTYFLEENVKDYSKDSDYSDSSRHGIQICFRKSKGGTSEKENGGLDSKDSSQALRLMEPSNASVLFIGSGKGKGGAEVRIVAGKFENACSSVSYQESVLLDVLMRPGSEANIPLNPSHGMIVYILEGVGIFNKSGLARPFYENEGHGIWFPPHVGSNFTHSSTPLRVLSHMWSALRFLVLTSPLP